MNALVIGAAGGVWEEIEAAKQLCQFDVIVAVKRIGYDYPHHIDHWVSFHAALFPDWIALRRRKGYPDVPYYWTSTYRGNARYGNEAYGVKLNLIKCEGGSSGLIGAMVGLRYAHRVVLAAIPMDPERGHYNKEGSWREAVKHRKSWEDALPELQGRVRSMSGWTKELLGEPTKEWLSVSYP